jgi:penicillin G amidase
MRLNRVVLIAVLSAMTPVSIAAQQRLDAGPQVEGTLQLPQLSEPVTVHRDQHGIPYIFARNTPDLIRAQGFVTAQNRLFQLEFYRRSITGRLAEVVGEAGLANDREMRLVGLRRNALRHAQTLAPEAREFIGWYVEGLNAYVAEHASDHPGELKLLGLTPHPWTVEDVVTILHFANWSQAANYKAELLTQKLIDRFGLEYVRGNLLPILVNPDRTENAERAPEGAASELALADGRVLFDLGAGSEWLAIGSNNWAVAPARSASGASVVVNDPHLDARALPGSWHPVGLHAPGIAAIGVALPGVPGLIIGRTGHVAFGVTNAYGDSQDLFVEQEAPGRPGHYLEDGEAIPFGTISETIRVRDKDAPGGFRNDTLVIRTTRRGPIVAEGLTGGKLLSLRSAAAEVASGGSLGIDRLLTARNVAEVDEAVQAMDVLYFNYVFGDTQGGIGHRASGRIPIRRSGHGAWPMAASAQDNWIGMLPPSAMPGQISPARGWVGTANHDTRPDSLGLYYTSYASPDYRYRRMKEVLDASSNMTTGDQLALMLDTQNLQAPRLLPALVAALESVPEHTDLASILAAWDGRDKADAAAPLIYHRLYQQVAYETFVDEMGESLAIDYLKQWYVWQERFDRLVATPDAAWFDDTRTPGRETLPDLIHRAAAIVRPKLAERHGADPAGWTWGSEHRIAFFSLLRPSGPERDAFGFPERAMDGSGETLMRARTAFMGEPVEFFASMRFVADLGDGEKVQSVLSGGAVDRQFHPHQKDQLPAWSDGKLLDWWLAPARIEANSAARQTLSPD